MLDHHDKRAILLMVLQVLENYSDEKHPLPMEGERSLQSYILRDYDLEKAPSRNTLSRNLKILWDGFGYDLHRVPGKGVYLQKRTLTRSQRQLLEDMVREARFLSPQEQTGILENLDALFRKKNYWGISQVSERFTGVNLRNRDFFRNLDVLEEALQKECQVRFTYNQMRPDGTLQPVPFGTRQQGGWLVHPFDLVYTNCQYYLIASVESYRNLRHFRIDHMTEVTLLPDSPRRPLGEIEGYEGQKRLDLEQYIREHLMMYGGETLDVKMVGTEKLSRYLWDNFGESVQVERTDPETGQVWFTVRLSQAAACQFARQYATECTVLAPESIRRQLAEDFRQAAMRYQEEKKTI